MESTPKSFENLDASCSLLMNYIHTPYQAIPDPVKKAIGELCGYVSQTRHTIRQEEILIEAAKKCEA